MTIQQTLLGSSGGLNWVQTTQAMLLNTGANDGGTHTYIGGPTSDLGVPIVTKYNVAANIIWSKRLNSSLSYSGIVYDSTGYIYVVSFASPSSLGVILSKLDTSGTLVWSTRYFFSFNITGIDVNSGGNIYVCGYDSASPITGYVLIFNSSGSLLNQIKIAGETTPYNRQLLPRNIKVDSSGNFYVSGRYQSSINNSYNNGFLIKFNSSASLIWSTELYDSVPTNSLENYGLAVDSSGNVYVGGQNTPFASGYIAKYNSSGGIQWQKNISNAFKIVDLAVTPDNYLYATSENVGVVLKMDTSGNGVYFNQLDGINFSKINVSGANVYLFGSSTALFGIATSALLPADGTKTVGTISGSFSYTAQTLTISTASYSVRTPTLTFTTPTNSTSASSVFVNDYTFTVSTPSYF